MNHPPNGYVNSRVLKLNVGFMLNESIGTFHEVTFDVPALIVAEDLRLVYLRGPLRLSRTSEGILVQGQVEIAVEVECGRCLNAVPLPLTLSLEELFSQQPGRSQFLIGEDAILDLAPLLREESILATPIAPACTLNADKTCPFGHDLEEYWSYVSQKDEIDPRFAILLQLRDSHRSED